MLKVFRKSFSKRRSWSSFKRRFVSIHHERLYVTDNKTRYKRRRQPRKHAIAKNETAKSIGYVKGSEAIEVVAGAEVAEEVATTTADIRAHRQDEDEHLTTMIAHYDETLTVTFRQEDGQEVEGMTGVGGARHLRDEQGLSGRPRAP